jgi:1-acyl-sn-glycerol-3-phosphate acyltransferase
MKKNIFYILRKCLYPFIRFFLIKEIKGLQNVPRSGAAILAFNHQSYLDFLTFVAISPRNVYYLTAEKFYASNLWRPIMNMTDQIKVERTSKNKEEVHLKVTKRLTQGDLIGIFPEGTRAPTAETMLPAYTGVAKYALSARVPIIPVGIVGAYEVWSRHKKTPSIKRRIVFNIGELITLEKYWDQEITKEVYEEITADVMRQIAELSHKKYGGIHK